jgi:hypothetical protein
MTKLQKNIKGTRKKWKGKKAGATFGSGYMYQGCTGVVRERFLLDKKIVHHNHILENAAVLVILQPFRGD